MLNNLARERAMAQGDTIYIGVPCKHGHAPERFVSTGACRECQRLSRKPYVKTAPKKKPELWRLSKNWTPTLANDKDAC